MSAVDPVGAAPEARRARFWWLLFGCSVAPLFWAGQLFLGYAISAFVCYPDDTPRMSGPGSLPVLLKAFDAVALAAALLGGAASLLAWYAARPNANDMSQMLRPDTGRIRFLALWGMLSSLWFFFAILFNSIASVMAPLCGE